MRYNVIGFQRKSGGTGSRECMETGELREPFSASPERMNLLKVET
jgi:hypothetical protein